MEEFGRDWPLPAGGMDSCTTIEWAPEHVVVNTGRQNATVLYYWASRAGNCYLLGSDLAGLTARAMALAGPQNDRLGQIRALRRDIRKIGGGRTAVFSVTGDRIDVRETVARVWTPALIAGESAQEAGERQVEILRQEIVASREPGPVTVVVSGGVDSGLVAALAQRTGVLDRLASLGTPWGNEYAAADELGAHLGLPVHRIPLSENDILRALPETIRMLGEPDRETIAAGVGLVAVYRQGAVPLGTVLTGVGSDLINSGHRVDADEVADLRAAVSDRLAEASLTSELSGVAAAAHGYVLRHMYWSPAVIQAALDTDPQVMRHRGREKGHLRTAAERLLPESVAWRPKQALHHGAGVDRNLEAAVARLLGGGAVDAGRFYRLVEAEVVEALLASPHESPDSDKCLDRAVAAYAR
ncbi:asparagine synthase C-terminal domain-containing protein [Nocardia sp. NPDC046763]|uniref:asparagine synthase C-terminal domain-containing protein n=1 Tax=Nocardia sp. NPDC046763 TaxID=3155256 RepID=UPI0033D42C9E